MDVSLEAMPLATVQFHAMNSNHPDIRTVPLALFVVLGKQHVKHLSTHKICI